MAYGDFKDLAKRRADKILRDKTFNIAKTPKYDGYQRGLASVVYKFFDKNSAGSGIDNNNNNNNNDNNDNSNNSNNNNNNNSNNNNNNNFFFYNSKIHKNVK